VLTFCQNKRYGCQISIHGQASPTQLFLINLTDTHVEVESHIAVLATMLRRVKLIWSFLKTICWKILSDKLWWSIYENRDEFFSARSCLVSCPQLSVCSAHLAFCLAFVSMAPCQMKNGVKFWNYEDYIGWFLGITCHSSVQNNVSTCFPTQSLQQAIKH
jgi:hypothetical protein